MKRILSLTLGLLATCVVFGQNHWSHTWKQFNHHTPALDYVGTLATPPADGGGHSLWSVGCETLDRDYAVFANYKEYLANLELAMRVSRADGQKPNRRRANMTTNGWIL